MFVCLPAELRYVDARQNKSVFVYMVAVLVLTPTLRIRLLKDKLFVNKELIHIPATIEIQRS